MSERRWRCVLCKSADLPFGLDFTSHEPQCPRCGGNEGAVLPLVYYHLYVSSPKDGPVFGAGGRRYKIACRPQLKSPNGAFCTGEASIVTCPECKKTKDYERVLEEQTACQGGVILT